MLKYFTYYTVLGVRASSQVRDALKREVYTPEYSEDYESSSSEEKEWDQKVQKAQSSISLEDRILKFIGEKLLC